jgi:CRP-like cAMP-binding protein
MALAQRIAANKLLAQLAPTDLALLTPYLKMSFLATGQVLQEAEAPVNEVWFPLSGMISLVVVKSSGDIVETGVVGREGVVNGLVGPGPWKSFSRAVVQLNGAASSLSIWRFQDAVQQSEQLQGLVLRYRELLLDQIQQTASCNALHPLESRLARWLLEAHDRVEGAKLALTQEFLSEMLGVRRTSVSSTLSKLLERGLIRQRRGAIVIMDRAGLERAACDCYATLHKHAADTFPEQVTGEPTALKSGDH